MQPLICVPLSENETVPVVGVGAPLTVGDTVAVYVTRLSLRTGLALEDRLVAVGIWLMTSDSVGEVEGA